MRKRNQQESDRRNYLQQLVTEFQDTTSREHKEQVLANLANFAYNPANYQFLRQLNVIYLFLDQLQDSNEKLVEFAIGGLSNLALDPENRKQIMKYNGIPSIISCLSSTTEETVISAITTMMFLTPESLRDVSTLPVIDCMLRFSESSNRRLSNLAKIFLQDFCTSDQIESVRREQGLLPTSVASSES